MLAAGGTGELRVPERPIARSMVAPAVLELTGGRPAEPHRDAIERSPVSR
jgi:hypothetical protein